MEKTKERKAERKSLTHWVKFEACTCGCGALLEVWGVVFAWEAGVFGWEAWGVGGGRMIQLLRTPEGRSWYGSCLLR
eukprot:1326953-Amorphochlora_amoeboformis.AAC.3